MVNLFAYTAVCALITKNTGAHYVVTMRTVKLNTTLTIAPAVLIVAKPVERTNYDQANGLPES
jgi:hypothetical protein